MKLRSIGLGCALALTCAGYYLLVASSTYARNDQALATRHDVYATINRQLASLPDGVSQVANPTRVMLGEFPPDKNIRSYLEQTGHWSGSTQLTFSLQVNDSYHKT